MGPNSLAMLPRNALRGRSVSEEHATHKYSFDFGIGAEGTSSSRMDCFFLPCVLLKPVSC